MPGARRLRAEKKRIVRLHDPGARTRDRAQTVSRAGHASARREGKPRGCAAPAA
jgi:hypothetical protein